MSSMFRFFLPAPVPRSVPDAPPLGRDIYAAGGLQVAADGDYRTIEDKEALEQALLRRLVTSPGEYAFHPDYGAGVRRAVNRSGSRAQLTQLRNLVLTQLRADERVRAVPAVSVTRIERGIRITATVTTSGGVLTLRPLEVTA